MDIRNARLLMALPYITHQRARLIRLQYRRWRQRLIFVAGGVAAGLINPEGVYHALSRRFYPTKSG